MRRPVRPEGIETPGLAWNQRKKTGKWVGYWTCRQDIAKRGFPIKTRRLWPSSEQETETEPTHDEWLSIASRCQSLQDEMLAWSRVSGAAYSPEMMFDDTFASLIRIYQQDEDSPFQGLRYHTKRHYESKLATLTKAVGSARVSQLSFRDFKRWHEKFSAPLEEGGPLRIARAHGLMTMVRLVTGFCGLLNLSRCREHSATLSEMTFQLPQRRVDFVNAEQAIAIRAEAHKQGMPSIALAQAIQFELMLRQKDVIGEWLPLSEPGTSDVIAYNQKWLVGIHWGEVDGNLVLEHRLSKSLRGKNAVIIKEAGKIERFDLNSYPMIMEELALIPVEKRVGPMVVAEHTGLPWRQKVFATKWRKIATAAGVPTNVQNRDSRAGGITEATDAIAAREPDFESVRRHAGHSQPSMTARYSRAHVGIKNQVAKMRSDARNKPKTG